MFSGGFKPAAQRDHHKDRCTDFEVNRFGSSQHIHHGDHIRGRDAGGNEVAELLVFNKVDVAEEDVLLRLRGRREPHIEVSALTGEGLDELLTTIAEMLPRPAQRVDVILPFSRGDLVSEAHRAGEVRSETHGEHGYHLVADVNDSLAARIREAATLAS